MNFYSISYETWDFPGGPVKLRHCTPNSGPSFITVKTLDPTRPRLRACVLRLRAQNATTKSENPMCHTGKMRAMKLKTLSVVTKTWRGQIELKKNNNL